MIMKLKQLVILLTAMGGLWASDIAARGLYPINDNWRSVCYPEGRFDSLTQQNLQLPHNWDDYYCHIAPGHQNLYGRARYERRFALTPLTKERDSRVLAGRRFLLRIEGAGSYLTVHVNGHEVCRRQPAGYVTTLLDITGLIHTTNPSAENRLVIECEHPSTDDVMPWTADPTDITRSQPFGLFRGVSIEMTDALAIEPFGVHAWANATLDTVFVETEIYNHNSHGESCVLQTTIGGKLKKETFSMGARLHQTVRQSIPMREVQLEHWTPEHPQLYTVTSTLMHGTQHEVTDQVETEVGFAVYDEQLMSRPLWGVAEREYLYGQSHALAPEEIDSRCQTIKHLTFNLFADDGEPHNLRYQQQWAKMGLLWWPQFSESRWQDTPEFRKTFQQLLRQWVKERRNNPALAVWDIQRGSQLPSDFVSECADIIRSMDPLCAPANALGRGRLILPSAEATSTGAFALAEGMHSSETPGIEQLHDALSQASESSQSVLVGYYGDAGTALMDHFGEPTDAYYISAAWAAYRQGQWPHPMPQPSLLSARDMVQAGYLCEGIPVPDSMLDGEMDNPVGSPEAHTFVQQTALLAPDPNRHYVYRYNCGGDEVRDSYGNLWMGDDTRYSQSWSTAPRFAQQHLSPVEGSHAMVPGWVTEPTEQNQQLLAARSDQDLLRSYRFGRQELRFTFPVVSPGLVYQVDLWFVNAHHQLKHVSYKVRQVRDGELVVAFPNVKAGQAKVSAIAISVDRLLASDYGKVEKGTFVFKSGLLKGNHPALHRQRGYPYDEGKTWRDLNR